MSWRHNGFVVGGGIVVGDSSADPNVQAQATPNATQARVSMSIDVMQRISSGEMPSRSEVAAIAGVAATAIGGPLAGAAVVVGIEIGFEVYDFLSGIFEGLSSPPRACNTPAVWMHYTDHKAWLPISMGPAETCLRAVLQADAERFLNCRSTVINPDVFRQVVANWNAVHDGPARTIARNPQSPIAGMFWDGLAQTANLPPQAWDPLNAMPDPSVTVNDGAFTGGAHLVNPMGAWGAFHPSTPAPSTPSTPGQIPAGPHLITLPPSAAFHPDAPQHPTADVPQGTPPMQWKRSDLLAAGSGAWGPIFIVTGPRCVAGPFPPFPGGAWWR